MLSKSYQYSSIESLLRVLTHQIALDKIVSKTLMKIVNKNTLDIAEMLNGATAPDYGSVQVLGDAAINYGADVSGGTFDTATKTITKTTHGLTSADIGKRIVIHFTSPVTVNAISTIVSITNANVFVINDAFSAYTTCSYTVLSAHTGTNLDVSSLKIDKIIKLSDSINKLVSSAPDLNFENLSVDDYSESLFYNHFGETLFLFKGSDIPAWGTLTLSYYRLPVLVTAVTDYIDMKDKHIPLLIDKCKLELYELANILPPKELSQSVESKTNLIRSANDSKLQTIMGKAK